MDDCKITRAFRNEDHITNRLTNNDKSSKFFGFWRNPFISDLDLLVCVDANGLFSFIDKIL